MHGIKTVGVVGAGQMGGGIAQVAAISGFATVVYDAVPASIERCKSDHAKRVARLVEKGTLTQADADAALGRLKYVSTLDSFAACDIVIEAIVEDLKAKHELFIKLAEMFARVPGEQYQLDQHHADRRGDQAHQGRKRCCARSDHRDALLQPRAGDETGGGD